MTNSPYAIHGERIVDLGYSAVPCRPGSKRPGAYSGGTWWGKNDWQQYCDRLPSEFETRSWSRWPDAGICVALGFSGVVAVDVDTDDPDMCEALQLAMPMSMVQKRGQKGFTAFYRASSAVKSAAFNVNGQRVVDLLSHGKQTVCPPTLHPDTGRPYVWLTEDTIENTHPRDLPELPDDIAERIAAALEPFGYAPTYTPRPAGEGYGNTIWREINTLALANLDAWVPALDLPKCKPGARGGYVAVPHWRRSNTGRALGERSPNLKISPDGIRDFHDGDRGYTPIDVVMASMGCTLQFADQWLRERLGYSEPSLYGLQPWFPKPAAANDDAPVVQAASPAPVSAPRGKVDPFTPSAAGGLLEAIADWTLDGGRKAVPEFAMMTAITFVAALYSRRAVTPTGAGLNVYLVGLGSSGLGKGHPLKALRTIASDSDMGGLVNAGNPTADSALERMLRQRPAMAIPWDEFGLVLQAVNARGGASPAGSVRRALLELYTLSSDMWMGKQYADPKRADPQPINNPTLSILGMSTPTTFYEGLTSENISDGFMNRITVIHATGTPPRRKAPAMMVTPPSLVAQIKKAEAESRAKDTGAYTDSTRRPKLHEVPYENEAVEQRWIEIEDWQHAEVEERDGHEGIVGRAAEQTIKFATLRALSRGGFRERVTMDDVEWGYAIVQRSLDCLDAGVREFMSGSDFEALTKAIMAGLRRTRDGALAWSVLLRTKGVSKFDDRTVSAAVERLVATGEIVRTGRPGQGQGIRLAAAAKSAA